MPQLPDDLFGYQKEDAERMASDGNWLNTSEMGTGKTITTLAVIEGNGYKCPLIVCPNSVRLEWKRQIDEWIGEDKTAVCTTDSYTKLKPIIYSFQEGRKYKVINYETLRNEQNLELLNMIPFDVIVFDEIHKLRNPKTKLVKGTWEFLTHRENASKEAGLNKLKVIGLSGSPIMNYPNDLYVPLTTIDPEKYPRTLREWNFFVSRYCMWAEGRYGSYIYGTRKIDRLREETKGFNIRRTKKEVLPFLPDKYYRRTLIDMDPQQRKLYDKMEKELMVMLDSGEPLWSTNVLSLLTRLRQINLDPKILGISCPSAKTLFLIDLIESTDEKIVVFSTFEKYIYYLSLMFPKSVSITGMVAPAERAKLVKRFQEDPETRLCFGTIQTMGEGITLTAASNVVLMDRWWNEPTNQQAIDRLHRIGQKNAVQVIIPVVEDSIDSSLDNILSRKAEASSQFFGEGNVRRMVIDDRRLL